MHLINNLNRARLTYFDQKLKKKKSLVGREFSQKGYQGLPMNVTSRSESNMSKALFHLMCIFCNINFYLVTGRLER